MTPCRHAVIQHAGLQATSGHWACRDNPSKAELVVLPAFLLTYCNEQSKREKVSPQFAKLPPSLGDSRLNACMKSEPAHSPIADVCQDCATTSSQGLLLTSIAPRIRKPGGEFRIPLIRCHAPPPTAPMPNAPPISSMILSGQGSRWFSNTLFC